jgi:hypothetical protein
MDTVGSDGIGITQGISGLSGPFSSFLSTPFHFALRPQFLEGAASRCKIDSRKTDPSKPKETGTMRYTKALILAVIVVTMVVGLAPCSASAQAPVVVGPWVAAPPVVGYVAERRGLIFPRIVYRPVVSYPAPVAVTTYYPPVAVAPAPVVAARIAPAPVTYYYAPSQALVVPRPFFGY